VKDQERDEVAMTPAAIEVRARMAHEWAASKAPEGVLPWSVRQHFGVDVPSMIEGLESAYRAGREDAARAGYAEAVARLRDDDRYRNWWTAHPDQQFGTAYWAPDGRQHLADYLETVGPDGPDVRTKPVDQSGVQPTEEQPDE
jgi:hypothetical protein